MFLLTRRLRSNSKSFSVVKWPHTVTNDMAVDDIIATTNIISMMRINRNDMESAVVAKIVSSRTNQAHQYNRSRLHLTILRPIRS